MVVSRGSSARARSLAERMARLDPHLDHVELRRAASELLRPVIGFDLAVWAVLDPSTTMWTTCVLDGAERDQQLENEVFANEYGPDDVLKLADLARAEGIGTMQGSTSGDPSTSPRYREVLAPRGFSDELRMVFSDGSSAWGALCLLRASGSFTPADVEALAPVGRPFARLLRSTLVRTGDVGLGSAPGTSGLVLVGPDGRVLDLSDEARALLGDPEAHELPQVLQSVLARRRAGDTSPATMPTPDGRWLGFSATPLGGAHAVIVEQARPHQLADIVVRAHGLTARERQVLEAVARGLSNRQIARELVMSEYTVQDHVKSVLAKFDVGSRSELVAALFFRHYLPHHGAAR